MDQSNIAIELTNVDKHFGAVHANDKVNLSVKIGTIHGIVGENGAGKSTLMSILYGFYQADSGQIKVLINNFEPPAHDNQLRLVLEWFINTLCWSIILPF
jgi:ABC-type uncharacterized transport system ATPase subunit